MKPLHNLRTRLSEAFGSGLRESSEWVDELADARMVHKVKQRHDGPGVAPDLATVAMAVSFFYRNGEPDGWRGLKRVCFGAGMIDGSGSCLLSDKALIDKLLALAESQPEARKRVRCYQSLLSTYWAFPLFSANARSRSGWLALREWLDRRMQPISRDFSRTPEWFRTLVDHRNLLHDNPCSRYGPKLIAGDGSEFQAALSGLGVPSDSWVLEEAVLAQMKTACQFSHEGFKHVLPDLLKVATGNAAFSPANSLQTKCVAILLSRYTRVPDKPEHPLLRDAAISIIGNPWLRRASWDSNVSDANGRPDEHAREMVLGWLKRRLITDFFELLSEDGVGDSRRLDYWLRFEPYVTDMWFALGANARGRRDEHFRDFLARARGRLLSLEAATADNNAFLMRVGDYVAMECGAIGNALYLYRWDDLPPAVSRRLVSGLDRENVTIHQLKNSDRISTEKPMRHVDSPKSLVSWEQKFDLILCPVLGHKPEKRPAFVPDLESLVRKYQIEADDKRLTGGLLFLYADDSNPAFNSRARALGFNYRRGGWYKC